VTIFDLLKNWPAEAILGALVVICIFALLVPVVLRIAGLQGQQIIDVMTLTLQFFINIVREFRAQNKQL